ncbi:MAG: Gfo/Idh/MocA family oxidoreductase [Acidobacteriia bacterium]|nr:Gfo/Idh/MocA family oxidoreductase [Terriglobia bacterium]
MSKHGISRRDFMRGAARATGATLAAKTILLEPGPGGCLSWAMGAAAKPVPPSDTIRMGIIGVGMQGSGLLNTSIHLPGVECVAACDLYDGRQTLAKQIVEKEIPTTRRYKELLDNKEIDCMIAAVPDHWHKQIVVDACNAGKDVYCEKPMTHHVSEGFEIIAAAEKNNRIVQIGSQRRSSVVYAKAKELLDQGAVGDVCLVEAHMGRNDPCGAWQYTVPPDLSPETVDWETWLGDAPKHAFDPLRWTRWRCWQDYGEGIPGDLFVHILTGIHYIAGITAPPQRAYSMGGLFRWKDGRDVPDVMTTVYDYSNFRATLRVTLNSETEEVTRFLGTKGILEIRNEALSLYPQGGVDYGPCAPGWPRKMKTEYAEKWHDEHDPKPGTESAVAAARYAAPPDYNQDREHLWNYFQSARTRRPSVEDAHFGNNTAIACHMANYSYFKKTAAVWNAGAKRIES